MDNKNEQIVALVRNKIPALMNLRYSKALDIPYFDAFIFSFIAYIYAYIAREKADPCVLDNLCLDVYNKIDPNHTILDEETLQILSQNGALAVDTVLYTISIGTRFEVLFTRETPNLPIDFLLNKFQHPYDDIYMCGEPFLTTCIQSKDIHWIVDEIDGVIWAIDVVRSYLHGWNATINHKELINDRQYKKIVCFHPYSNEDFSISFLKTIYNKLEDGGEMVVVTPSVTLFGLPYKNVRKQWLEDGALREIYDLGNGWIDATNFVRTSVLVLQKPDKKSFSLFTHRNSEVRFVDLAAYAKTNHLSPQQMHELLCKKNLGVYEENVSAICTNEMLLKDELVNLSPSSIIAQAKSKDISNAVRLADIILDEKIRTIYQTTYLDLTTEFIAQNINSSFEVDLSSCPTRKFTKEQIVQLVDYDAVIVSSISSKIKPFLYRHKGNEPIVLSRSWLVLRLPENSDTTLDYLVTEMSLDYFAEQVQELNSGSIMSRLSKRDLHRLYIVLPPTKEEQQERLHENRDKMLTGILEAQSAMLKDLLKLEKEKYIKAVRTRKHTMGNLLFELIPTLDSLLYVIDNDEMLGNYIVSTRQQKTLKDYIENIKSSIKKLSSNLTLLVEDIEMADYSLERVNIIDYIDKWLQMRPLTDKYIIKAYNRLEVEDIEVEVSNRFTEVLDNIFTNAVKHGFMDAARENYVIRIVYEATENGDLSIKIANNGSGLAEGMTEESVFDYRQTSGNGEGIGGWHVREIVKQSHGSVKLHYNPSAEDGFMIEYEIILPTV